mgnify:CR=1 FL=1
MRKFLLCLLILTISMSFGVVYAEDVDWSTIGNPDNAWDGQKPITNKEFEEVVSELEKQKNKNKRGGQKPMKGMDLNRSGSDAELLTNINTALPLLNLPVPVYINGQILIPGHYKVVGEKENNKVYLKFYQGHSMLAKIEAYETEDDFGSEDIYFLKYEELPNHQLKIMFGSMEFNAFTFVTYLNN